MAPNDTPGGTGTPSGDQAPPRDLEEIRAEVEQNREELGQTVEALTAKLDVKTRAQQRLSAMRGQAEARVHAVRVRAIQLSSRAKETAVDEQGRPRPVVPAAGAALLAVTITGLLVRSRRRR